MYFSFSLLYTQYIDAPITMKLLVRCNYYNVKKHIWIYHLHDLELYD